jgi:hypothetical protein
MKKLAIIIIVLGVAFSYSCDKNGRKVQTSISGTMITNGTNDPIRLSVELPNPRVVVFHASGGGFISGGSWDEIASVMVDNNANFYFDLDLYEDDDYYLGFYDVDGSKYVDLYSWYYVDFYPISPGNNNNGVKLHVLAHSWITPRFINTNPDPNNNDVFKVISGLPIDIAIIDTNHIAGTNLQFVGAVDTLIGSLFRTWSGQTQYGGANSMNHEVHGKLTRNGVTTDVIIPYNVPPFDTTVVEIRY